MKNVQPERPFSPVSKRPLELISRNLRPRIEPGRELPKLTLFRVWLLVRVMFGFGVVCNQPGCASSRISHGDWFAAGLPRTKSGPNGVSVYLPLTSVVVHISPSPASHLPLRAP